MNRHDPVEVARLLAMNVPEIGKGDEPAPEVSGARMTALGAKVLAMQNENAKRLEASDGFGFPVKDAGDGEQHPAVNNEAAPESVKPEVVQIFNVGESYTIAPSAKPGKPAPIVRKIHNKFARRVLRKRANEGRVGRAVRESSAQLQDARRVTDSMHEAKHLVQAQREYQREKGDE